jgi:hypothetical protein
MENQNTMHSVEMQPIISTPPINLMKAIAQFQNDCPIIHKGTKGFGYSYADLPTIIETITPILTKHELGFTQIINGPMLKTFIFHHPTGESIESNMEINAIEMKGMNMMQSFGACLTYYRRY